MIFFPGQTHFSTIAEKQMISFCETQEEILVEQNKSEVSERLIKTKKLMFMDDIAPCCLKEGTDSELLEFIKSSDYPAYSEVNIEELQPQLMPGEWLSSRLTHRTKVSTDFPANVVTLHEAF